MDASENRSLLILLRGIGGDHHDFEALGVIAEIRRRDLPFDIVAPNAHYGYYKSRTLVERLYRDIIEPAQRRGYRRIWLAGFSMGGLGSLLYMRERPQDLDAVMLISPFLGRDDMIREITEAGGLGNWQAGPIEDHDWERLLWSWIKKYSESPAIYPQIYLGFGKQDQLVGDGSALLATVLNNEHVLTVDGRHDKKQWLKSFSTSWMCSRRSSVTESVTTI